MKVALHFKLPFAFFAISNAICADNTLGRTVELDTGASPNARFTIKVEQKGASNAAPNDIRYSVVERKTGRTILNIPSQYSGGVETNYIDHDRQHKFGDATGAWVKWNRQSTLVALSEYPWHGYGHLFVVAITHRTRAVLLNLPPQKLVACEPGEKTQCATRDDDPWLDDRTLRFYCGGCGGREIVVAIADDLQLKINSIRPD